MREMVIASLAFAFFVVCPRMAGMVGIIGKNTSLPLWKVTVFGTIASIPILALMAWVFPRWGVGGALVLCVITDMAAVFLMKDIGVGAAIQTAVVAIFVLLGIKAGQWLVP
ncbi:MAG: hypothetical protein U9R40_07320 [Synergistota bacterium]|nr:hypothetical protein [Synergistota bacterium]